MKFGLLLVFLTLLFSSNIYSQKEYYNWAFGNNCGITFNTPTGNPQVWPDVKFYSLLSSSSISDKNGNFLFCTDGKYLKNKKFEYMQNDSDTSWQHDPSSGLLVVRKPDSDSLYYIFESHDYVDDWDEQPGLYYSIVDISKNNGLGAVIGNYSLIEGDTAFSDDICAVRHFNNKDIWLIFKRADTNVFYTYLLTSSGVNPNPVISKTGEFHRNIFYQYYHYYNHSLWGERIKASSDGKKIAVLEWTDSSLVELLDFDNKTGLLSHTSYLKNCYKNDYKDGSNHRNHGVEFSPNGKFLYITMEYDSTNQPYSNRFIKLLQCDISKNKPLIEKKDIITIDSISLWDCMTAKGELSALQIGPDGRIYVSRFNQKYLGVINKPNEKGLNCNYIPNGFYLGEGHCTYGLVNALYDLFKFSLSSDVICEGDTLKIFSSSKTGLTNKAYEWSGPYGFTSTDANIFRHDAKPGMSGWYYLKANLDGYIHKDSIYVNVFPNPQIYFNITSPVSICKGDSIEIKAMPEAGGTIYNYNWSTGEKESAITVKKAGKYILTTETVNGCVRIDTLQVIVNDPPKAEIEGTLIFCRGDSTTLSSMYRENGYKYRWTGGGTTPEIVVKDDGTYILEVENEFGCKAFDSVVVMFMPASNPTIAILSGKPVVCEGEEVILDAGSDDLSYSYLWSTGDTTPTIKVYKTGVYFLTVSKEGACSGFDTVEIIVNPNPTVAIEGSNEICSGDTSIIRIDREFASYFWSTGDTAREIKITKGGKYSVTVIDSNGCTASDDINITDKFTILALSQDLVFGSVCTGDLVMKSIEIKNEGKDTIFTKNIAFLNPETPFSVIVKTIKLDPGEIYAINVLFDPRKIGKYEDSLLIHVAEPCEATYLVHVSGISKARTSAWLPDTLLSIGDRVSIPVYFKTICGIMPSDAEYDADISFDASLLRPDATQPAGVTDMGTYSTKRLFNIKGKESALFNGHIMLAEKDSTVLEISRIDWNYKDYIETDRNSGSVKIEGICRPNMSRIKFIGGLGLSIQPNPATDEVNLCITGDGKGKIKLFVYTSEGLMKTEYEFEKKEWQKDVIIDLKEYCSGLYRVVIQSNGETAIESMVVVK